MARKFLTAALIYFILGLLAQAVAVFDSWLGFNPLAYTTVAATERALLFGWLTQLGLALLYHTRFLSSQSVRPSDPRNLQLEAQNSKLDLAIFVLFNMGLPLTIAGQPGLILFGGAWLGVIAALGGLLQLCAGLLFAGQAWRAARKMMDDEP